MLCNKNNSRVRLAVRMSGWWTVAEWSSVIRSERTTASTRLIICRNVELYAPSRLLRARTKHAAIFLPLTWTNPDRFSKFFHRQTY